MKHAYGFAEQVKNNKEFDASDWVKKEKMLGQRNQKKVPVGLGIIDDTKSFFKRQYNDANDFITKVKYGRTDLSPKVKKILEQHGTATILYARVGRKPITSAISMIVKTFGNTPYDTLFHLFIELQLSDGNSLIVEKNAQINMDVNRQMTNSQYMPVPNVPQGLTVNQLILNTKNKMGSKFIPYSASSNNCQNFILQLLRANNMTTPQLEVFVKQDTEDIFKDENFKKFANTITDLGNRIDIIRQGGQLETKRALNETNDKELDRLMVYYNIKKYHGAFVKDELPAKLKNGFYIINLNGKSHWTAMLKHGKKYYYFDSFGFPAPTDIEDKIPKEYIYSEKHIQTEPTSSCGFYVVAFIKYMNEHKNKQVAYEDFINAFEVDSTRNEYILKKYFLE
jgi:hypothetical protein